MTMHHKFQQFSQIYSGWCLRFCSSTECWLSVASQRHGSQCKLCRRFELPWCSSGKVSTRPLVCKRHGYVLTVQNHGDSSVAVHWQSDRCWVCWSCSSSVPVVEETGELPLLQSSSLVQTFENCAGPAVAVLLRGRCPCCAGSSWRPVLDKVVDMPVVVQRQGFSKWRCHRYSSSPV